MNRKEALAFLNLPESASKEQIKEAYNKRHNIYQSKIVDAPTGKIRDKVAANLEKLTTAYNILAASKNINIDPSTLPSTNPIAKVIENTNSRNVQNPISFTEEDYQKAKRQRNYALWFAILSLVASTVLLAYWLTTKEKQEGIITRLKQENTFKQDSLAVLKGKIKNYEFHIKNGTDETIYIKGFKTFFFDEENTMQSYLKTYKAPKELATGVGYDPEMNEFGGSKFIPAIAYFIVYGTKSGIDKTDSGILNEKKQQAQIYAN